MSLRWLRDVPIRRKLGVILLLASAAAAAAAALVALVHASGAVPLLARLPPYGVLWTAVLVALLTVSLVAAGAAQKLILTPLADLAATARRAILEKDYGVRAAARDGDEIGALAATFNDALDTLEENDAARRRAEEGLRASSQQLEEGIAERTRELEAAQERAMRQERLAFLGQLAGGVSHELRRPLATMGNSLYYLKTVHGDGDERTRKHVDMIRTQINNMDQLIHDLVDALRVRPQAVGLLELASWLDGVLARHPPPANVTVASEVAGELPAVWVDSSQLEQALSNLLANAFQAMPEGGELVLRAAACRDGVCLSLRDTGCGIAEENLASIFEPLFTTKARGIGLGLTVAKNLVEANGGRLEVESAAGEGTTFNVYFTTRPPASPDDAEAAAPA